MKGQSVEYIRKKDLKRIFEYLEKNKKIVILAIVKFALNTGLRISDILKLKFENLNFKNFSTIKEKKTRKIKKIFFNKICNEYVEILKKYYFKEGYSDFDRGYLFKSSFKKDSPISYQGVNFYISILKKELNIDYPFNTHSFRKTWARTVYKKYNDIVLVMKLLNHSSISITLRYIGIDEDKLNDVYNSIYL